MFEFYVVPGSAVSAILTRSRRRVIDVVAQTYRLHEQRRTINPDSYFLRFPNRPNCRMIALLAHVGRSVDRIGIKWIGSFPDNIVDGLPRASAVLVLNDAVTGYPVACLEAGGISAARTAASVALAVRELTGRATDPLSVSFVGAGVIARTIMDYLAEIGLRVGSLACHDLEPTSANHLLDHARQTLAGAVPRRASDLADALGRDVVVFATTAATPHVPVSTRLRAGQVLVNVSLRDLPPELILSSNNVVDDVEHCLKAQTSPHLAERRSGSRTFINGTLGSLLDGGVHLDDDKATVFSPFGLGSLDVALGDVVLSEALRAGTAVSIVDFFGETTRW